MTTSCPYDTLGIRRSATSAQIKYAFTSLSEIYHPSRHLSNKTTYNAILQAYLYLIDTTTRPFFQKFGTSHPTPAQLKIAWEKAKHKKLALSKTTKTNNDEEAVGKKFYRRKKDLEEQMENEVILEDIRQADLLMDSAVQSARQVRESVYVGFTELCQTLVVINEAENLFRTLIIPRDPVTWKIMCSDSDIKKVKSLLDKSYQSARNVQKAKFEELVSEARMSLETASGQIDKLKSKNNKMQADLSIQNTILKKNIFSKLIKESKELRSRLERVVKILKGKVLCLEGTIKEIIFFGMPEQEKILLTVQKAHEVCDNRFKAYLNARKNFKIDLICDSEDKINSLSQKLDELIAEKADLANLVDSMMSAKRKKEDLVNSMQQEFSNLICGRFSGIVSSEKSCGKGSSSENFGLSLEDASESPSGGNVQIETENSAQSLGLSLEDTGESPSRGEVQMGQDRIGLNLELVVEKNGDSPGGEEVQTEKGSSTVDFEQSLENTGESPGGGEVQMGKDRIVVNLELDVENNGESPGGGELQTEKESSAVDFGQSLEDTGESPGGGEVQMEKGRSADDQSLSKEDNTESPSVVGEQLEKGKSADNLGLSKEDNGESPDWDEMQIGKGSSSEDLGLSIDRNGKDKDPGEEELCETMDGNECVGLCPDVKKFGKMSYSVEPNNLVGQCTGPKKMRKSHKPKIHKTINKKHKSSIDASHKCKICGQPFTKLQNLYRHNKIHSQIELQKFHCTYCAYFARRKDNLFRHLKDVHKIK